jgi:hypothetical protein
MLLVEIEKPETMTLVAWFSELRTWLDLNHCEPATFIASGRRIDRLIYRISFEHAAEAQQFATAFAQYSATVRRASPMERDRLRGLAEPPPTGDPLVVGAAD